MKSCKSHEKKWNKEHQTLSFQFFINKSRILMLFVLFFQVVGKISNFNIWTAKHLVKASCTELTLVKVVSIVFGFSLINFNFPKLRKQNYYWSNDFFGPTRNLFSQFWAADFFKSQILRNDIQYSNFYIYSKIDLRDAKDNNFEILFSASWSW